MGYRGKFFKTSIGALLILMIIFLSLKILPNFYFIISVLKTFLYPIIFAFVFYYLFRPLRNFLEKKKFPRTLAIFIIFAMLFSFIIFIMMYFWPYLSIQIDEFSSTPKEKIEEIQNKTIDFMDLFNFTAIPREQLEQNLTLYSKKIIKLFTDNILLTLSSIAQIATYFIITPLLLFYLLKEDHKIKANVMAITSKKNKKIVEKIGHDIDTNLSFFINSQIFVAMIVGCLIFAGYLFIGLRYSFVLAFMAFIFNIIPFSGPFISTIPAVLVGLADSPSMGLKVFIVVIAVHLLDMNIISPRIVGHRLNIHPMTIIFLLIGIFPLFGFAGLFLVTPLYAILKSMATDLYELKNGKGKKNK